MKEIILYLIIRLYLDKAKLPYHQQILHSRLPIFSALASDTALIASLQFFAPRQVLEA
jgi:hypothetical protein